MNKEISNDKKNSSPATKLAGLLMQKIFVPKMKEILETEEEITHEEVIKFIKESKNDEKIKKEIKNSNDAKINAYVITGEIKHDSNWPPEMPKGTFKDNLIFACVEVELENEKSIIGRTYGVNNTKETKQKYNKILNQQNKIENEFKIGKKIEEIKKRIEKEEEIEIEILLLKGEETIENGSSIMLKIWNEEVMIIDTYTCAETKIVSFSKLFVLSKPNKVFFQFEEEEVEEKPTEKLSKFRERKEDIEGEDPLKEYEKQRKQTMEVEQKKETKNEEKEEEKENPKCYKNIKEIPNKNTHLITVDKQKFALLLPINDRLVPFHVAYIKSITTREGFFRVNFNVPRESKDGIVYIKELSFHVKDQERINKVEQSVKEMKKKWTDEETIRSFKPSKEEVLIKRKEGIPVLKQVCITPVLKGKKTEGMLEAHMNGFRFVSQDGTVDLMYNNIKHAFFQDGEKETIILLHFFMDPPVIIQNKPIHHVQFYNEIMDISYNIDKGGERYYSEREELHEEQQEKQKRYRLKQLYYDFLKKIEKKEVPVEFEIPFRELKFGGTIKRNTATMVPTLKCLINISDPPFKVIEINEIDIVVFERLTRNLTLKLFDMVILFKDLSKQPLQITSVSKDDLAHIKRWLETCSIQNIEKQTSLQWDKLIESVRQDPEEFKKTGWDFLKDESETNSESEDEAFYSDDFKEMETSEDSMSDSITSEESSDVESEDTGESWSEMERKALIDDAKKDRMESEIYSRMDMQRRTSTTRRPQNNQRQRTIQSFLNKTSTTTKAPAFSSNALRAPTHKVLNKAPSSMNRLTFSSGSNLKRAPQKPLTFKRKP